MTWSQTTALRPMTTTCPFWRLRATAVVENGQVSLDPSSPWWTRTRNSHVSSAFSHACPATATCYHVLAAKMAVGLPIGDAQGREVDLTQLRRNKLNANELTRRPAGCAWRGCDTGSWRWRWRHNSARDSCNWHTCCDVASRSAARAWTTGVAASCSKTGCRWRRKPWRLRDLQPVLSAAAQVTCSERTVARMWPLPSIWFHRVCVCVCMCVCGHWCTVQSFTCDFCL